MMFINPNEFELLQYLEAREQIQPDETPAAGPQPALRVTLRRLARRHGDRVALQALDLDIAPGEFVAVVGRGGSGKSTLLNLLAGRLAPSGEQAGAPERSPVLFDNFPSWAPDSRVRLLQPDARLLPWKTVLGNAALGLSGTAQALEALRLVGLLDRGGDWPAQLSEAQRQRVALARALARRPGLLLLDEPYAGLDAIARIEMQRLLEEVWRQQGCTTVLATHDAAEAVALADRILVLDEGGVVLTSESISRVRAGAGSAAFAALEARVLNAALQQDAAAGDRPLAPVIHIRHLRLAGLKPQPGIHAQAARRPYFRSKTMSIQSINARNQFRGKIKEIILGPVVSEVDVDTPAGIVTSVITTRSVKELDLQVGTEVLAFVKATEVSVAKL